jgi:hypothetical protein
MLLLYTMVALVFVFWVHCGSLKDLRRASYELFQDNQSSVLKITSLLM